MTGASLKLAWAPGFVLGILCVDATIDGLLLNVVESPSHRYIGTVWRAHVVKGSEEIARTVECDTALVAQEYAEQLVTTYLLQRVEDIQKALDTLRGPRCRAICPEGALAWGDRCVLGRVPEHDVHEAKSTINSSWPTKLTTRWAPEDGS